MADFAANLVTLEEYKAYAGLNTPNQDTAINKVIPGVCEYVETYCNRKFQKHLIEPTVGIYSGKLHPIYLKHHPVTQIVSVDVSEDSGATYTPIVEYVDWILDREEGAIISPLGYFVPGPNKYRIGYNYGFEVLPEDLKLAIFDLIKYYLRNDMAVHSNKAPGTNSVQLDYQSSANIPGHIRRILNMYKVDYV